MAHARSGVVIRTCLALLGELLAASRMTAQSDTTIPSAEVQKAGREYAEMLGRVQEGDMTVDFRAFRVAGALKSGPHASELETNERAAFRTIMASGDSTGALDSAKRALERNCASPIAQYDAMSAYRRWERLLRQRPTRRFSMRCLTRFANPAMARARRPHTSSSRFRRSIFFSTGCYRSGPRRKTG